MTKSVDISQDMQQIIADLLGIELDEAMPEASFEADLGGESIDYLDLAFRCETHFGVRVEFQNLIDAKDVPTDEQGVLLPEARDAVKRAVPALDVSKLETDATMRQLRDLVTVDVLTRVMQQAIERHEQRE